MAQPNLAGFPKTVIQSSDISTLLANVLKGRFCVQLITERGEVNKSVLITSSIDFKRKLGGIIAGTTGGIVAQRALDGGAQLYVSRSGHYTNPADKSTLVGAKSSGTLSKVQVAETLATGGFLVTGAGATDDTVTLYLNTGDGGIITLGSYTVLVTDTTVTLVATGLKAAINTLTGTHGYVASGSAGNIILTAGAGTGALPNGYTLTKTITGTVAGTLTQFTGGVTAISSGQAGSAVFAGKNIGPAYACTVTTTAAKSGLSAHVDIKIELSGYPDITETILDVPQVPTADEKTFANGQSALIDLGTVTTRIPIGTVTLSGGTYDTSLLVDSDYIGVSAAGTGVYAFNNVLDANRLVNIERASNPVDAAYNTYCAARKDMRAMLRFPLNLTPEGALTYRNQTSPYSGVLIDDWYSMYIYGDIEVFHPEDATQKIVIPAIGDILGLRAKTDNSGGEWISTAGADNGKLSNVIRLTYNVGSPALSGIADTIYEAGINVVINHESFGFVYWGNKSNLKDGTKLLSKDNICDLMIVITRFLKKMGDKQLFKPNDPLMWSALYREAKQFITQTLEKGRAIRPGENTQWFWLGDQTADRAEDATFNQQTDLDAGKYRVRFVFRPVPATEYIGIEATATDAANLQIGIVNP